MRLRARAPGKVNLCLFLGGTRDDGRHHLVTLIESVSLADELTLTTLDPGQSDEVRCPAVAGVNLASKALAALRAAGWRGPPVRIEIAKRIPVAAGMGGGSADAAATLRLAGELAGGLALGRAEVAALAAALGADVPSQLSPGLVLGTGVGETIQPVAPLAPHAFVLIPLADALSTPDVYREADRLRLAREPQQLEDAHAQLLDQLRPGARLPASLLLNELQPAAASLSAAVPGALAAARGCGAEETMVCGSGPTVAGLFWGEDGRTRAEVAAAELSGRFPGALAATPVGPEFGSPTVS